MPLPEDSQNSKASLGTLAKMEGIVLNPFKREVVSFATSDLDYYI